MRTQWCWLAVVMAAAGPAAAADPVVIDLPERASSRTAVVTVGGVARLGGGDAALRDQIARLDLAEMKVRDPAVTLTRRVIEYRLQLAGIEAGAAVVTGADRITVTAARRPVTAEEVAAAARAEVVRRLPGSPEAYAVEQTQPIVVPLPAVPEAEPVTVAAWPHGRSALGPGRVQMDVAVFAAGEKLLSLPVYFDVRSAAPAAGVSGPPRAVPTPAPLAPAGAAFPAAGVPGPPGVVPALTPLTTPAGAALPQAAPRVTPPGEVLVKPRQRVRMVVKLGAVDVTAVGEAQQEGRLGQSILLQNVDSKKAVTGRVVGPATVEIDIGGAP